MGVSSSIYCSVSSSIYRVSEVLKMRALVVLSSVLVYTASATPIFERAEQVALSAIGLVTDNTYEEAPHTEKQLSDGIVERNYPEKKWACTDKTVDSESEADQGQMFWRLFGYIQGENEENKKIKMTVPVKTLVKAENSDTKLEMCFFIGEEHQSNPPTPTNQKVSIKQFGGKLYTRTLSGYMNTDTWRQEAQQLKQKLNDLSIKFDSSRYYKVGYDAPFKFWNRRNEVWYMDN